MPQPKYVVIALADLRSILNDDQKNQLISLLGVIEQGRRQSGKPATETYFTMNMRDKYAQAAIEKYIQAIHEDSTVVGNAGVEQALAAAQEARTKGIMAGAPRLPTLPQ